MKIDFVVHSVVDGPVSVDAIVDGENVTARVDGLEVELTTVLSRHGTLTLRFAGNDLAEAQSLFKKDRKVSFVAVEDKAGK